MSDTTNNTPPEKFLTARVLCFKLQEIEKVTGSIKRKELFKELMPYHDTIELVDLIFNPYKPFGATPGLTETDTPWGDEITEEFEGESDPMDLPLTPVIETMNQMQLGTLRGNEAKSKMDEVIKSYPDQARNYIRRFFNKTFCKGIGESVIQTFYEKLFFGHDPMLAAGWNEANLKKWLQSDSVWIEPKYDGARSLAFAPQWCMSLPKEFKDRFLDREFVATSRSIKQWHHENVAHIIESLAPILEKGWCLDGEFLAEDWNETMSIVSSEFKHEKCLSLKFYIFDVFPANLLNTKFTFDKSYLERREWLENWLQAQKLDHIVVAPKFVVRSVEEAFRYKDMFIESGFEGGVLKRGKSIYDFSRSFMKAKCSTRDDYEILEVCAPDPESKFNVPPTELQKTQLVKKGYSLDEVNSVKHTIGSLTVSVNGSPSNVGTGFDDIERYGLQILHDRGELIGKWAEIEAHSVTRDNALREPSYKMLRLDK